MAEAPVVTLIRDLTFGASPWKPAVRALAAANVTRSGPQTIDGVAVVRDELVLLTGQTNATENGPWIVKDAAWTRPLWFDQDSEVFAGTTVYIAEGGTYAQQFWTLTTTGSSGRIRLGFDNLTWSQEILGGGAPLDQAYWIDGTPDVSLTNAVNTRAVTTTLEVASTTTIPLARKRTDAATASLVDVEKTTVISAGTPLANFGGSHLWQAKNGAGSTVDLARAGFRWSNPAAAAEASQWVLQLRNAGAALATALTVDGNGNVTTAGTVYAAGLDRAGAAVAIGATATSVAITPATSVAGALTIGSSIDRIAAGALTIGATTASSVYLSRSGGGVRLVNLAGGGTTLLQVDNSGDVSSAGIGTTTLTTALAAKVLENDTTASFASGVPIQALTSTLTFSYNGGLPVNLVRFAASNNSVLDGLRVARYSTAAGAIGLGTSITIEGWHDGEDVAEIGKIAATMTSAVAATYASTLGFSAATGGALVEVATLTGGGVFTVTGSFLGPSLDRASAGALTIAGTTATSATVGSDGTNTAISHRVTAGGTHTWYTNNTQRLQISSSIATFGTATVKWQVGQTVPYNGGDSTGGVTLDFSQSNIIEVDALVDNVTFTISGAVTGANYTVIVRQHASSAKTTTWSNGLFKSGDDAIGTTVNTYTAWQFAIMTGGTIVCINVTKDIVIP